jgi:hypothetical protein
MASSDEIVTLNVGGKLFRTTRATLTKHPDSMLAAMFRGDMQASGLRDEQGHPFLDRDPTHFPFILAYLRDGCLPPLPSGLLELQQLKVEAEFFAMAELAEAAGAAAAAIEARSQAAQEIEEARMAALRAAEEAVVAAQLKYDTIKAALAPLRAAQQQAGQLLYDLERRADAELADDDAAEADPEADDQFLRRLEDAEDRARELHLQLEPEMEREAPAAAKLRDALLARLCALGADLPAAEAQLRATHPQLEAEARRKS